MFLASQNPPIGKIGNLESNSVVAARRGEEIKLVPKIIFIVDSKLWVLLFNFD